MLKKIYFLLVPILLFLPGGAFGLEMGNHEVQLTVLESFASRYIWRGQDLFSENDPAYQPSIDIALPDFLDRVDVSFNVWAAIPLNNGHEDGQEVDYAVTLSNDIFDNTFEVSTGYTYFDFPNTRSTADVQEPWVSLTLNKIPALPVDVSMTIFAGYDFKAVSGGPDEGWYYSWKLGSEIPLARTAFTQKDQNLSLGITNWGNDGVADLKPSVLYATEFSFSTTYKFGILNISPCLTYIINHEDEINSGNEEIFGGIELAYVF